MSTIIVQCPYCKTKFEIENTKKLTTCNNCGATIEVEKPKTIQPIQKIIEPTEQQKKLSEQQKDFNNKQLKGCLKLGLFITVLSSLVFLITFVIAKAIEVQ